MSHLKEETLCGKHKNFNKKVSDAVKENKVLKYSIMYEDTDLDNLLRVDVACHTRNIDFLLEVFKCEDMLYISRAIRHSIWLVESQYAYIINPQYLYIELLPYMLTEAWNKLLQHIRINLKDPTRFEGFYNYIENIDADSAIKWLPKCSIGFIVDKFRNRMDIIPEHIVFRLFTISVEVFKIYCEMKKTSLRLDKAFCLIKTNGNEFFDILDGLSCSQLPKFNKKITKLIMKVCPHRLLSNLNHYQNHIDIPCFLKYCTQDDFEKFQSKYKTNEILAYYFSKQRQKEDVIFCYGEHVLSELDSCDPNNHTIIKDILTKFEENISKFSMDQMLKFINKFISKCHVHRFDSLMWSSYNDILKKIMKIKQYSERNKTIQSYIKTVVFYKIVHKENVPEEIMSQFKFDESLKVFQKKISNEENSIIFNFLYNYAFSQLKILPHKIFWIENIFILLKCWNRSVENYPLFNKEISKVVQNLEKESGYDVLKSLYTDSTRKFWRRYLLNEKIIVEPVTSDTFLNILKHSPDLIPLKDLERISECKSTRLFYRKLRTYWSHSIAQRYKDLLFTNLHKSPSIGLYILLSREEYLNFIQRNAPKYKLVSESQMEKSSIEVHIAKHLSKVYPKLSVEKALMYFKGLPMLNTLSSINSILQGMSIQKMSESLSNLNKWPEIIQKLCVCIIFSQPQYYYYKREIILKIWEVTNHPSVRAEIFKKSMKALFIYKNKTNNSNYKPIIEKWQFLLCLMDRLGKDESLMLYNLPKSFQKLPTMRDDFCLKYFQMTKSFPLKCGIFPRKPLMCYFSGGLHLIDHDILAAMVNDTITEMLWTTKLNSRYIQLIVSCDFSWKDNAEQIIAFKKILAPLFERAYKIMDIKTVNIQLVRYNLNKIISWFNITYTRCIDEDLSPPVILELLLEGLENNVSIKDNYLMIRETSLAVDYCNILLLLYKNQNSTDVVMETSISMFAVHCVKTFCKDIANYGACVWNLFYHALHKTLDRFPLKRLIRYKLYNSMLDLCKDLTAEQDILIHILVYQLTFYICDSFRFLFDFDLDSSDEDNEQCQHYSQKLLYRVKSHCSNEVKAFYSESVISNISKVYYKEFKYM